MTIGTWNVWMLIEASETAGEMLRFAYDTSTSEVFMVCDSAQVVFDPDTAVPQQVIDIHLDNITRKVGV